MSKKFMLLLSVTLLSAVFFLKCGFKSPPTPIYDGFESRYQTEIDERIAQATPTPLPSKKKSKKEDYYYFGQDDMISNGSRSGPSNAIETEKNPKAESKKKKKK